MSYRDEIRREAGQLVRESRSIHPIWRLAIIASLLGGGYLAIEILRATGIIK